MCSHFVTVVNAVIHTIAELPVIPAAVLGLWGLKCFRSIVGFVTQERSPWRTAVLKWKYEIPSTHCSFVLTL